MGLTALENVRENAQHRVPKIVPTIVIRHVQMLVAKDARTTAEQNVQRHVKMTVHTIALEHVLMIVHIIALEHVLMIVHTIAVETVLMIVQQAAREIVCKVALEDVKRHAFRLVEPLLASLCAQETVEVG